MASSTSERNPYLEGNYAPVHDELDVRNLEVVGEVPKDLSGVFLRNGANPLYPPQGKYHWFDGDGMVHAVRFDDGRVSYRNRFVQTKALVREREAGHGLFSGSTERRDLASPAPLKDTANTDLVFHGGKLLALWWLGGEPYRLDPATLETLGTESFDGKMKLVASHPKVDLGSGELMVFDAKPTPPYLTYGVADREGRLVHKTTIDLKGPRLSHDLAITEHYTLFFDMSLMWDAQRLAKGQTKVRFYRDVPTRFGVLPRKGEGADIRWFEVAPCYMYHAVNAWEEGDEIVLVGCKIDNPLAGDEWNPTTIRITPSIGFLRLEPFLTRWRLNLKSGQAREERLDMRLAEMPRVHPGHVGRASRYAYLSTLAHEMTVYFDGLVKYDLVTEHHQSYTFPAGSFGGEVAFVARSGATAEDDGYLMTYVTSETSLSTELFIFDARDIQSGPISKVRLPRRVPAGFHGTWVPGEALAGA